MGYGSVYKPPYSSDLTPMGYSLYPSMVNRSHKKKFDDKNDLKIYLLIFFNQKF